MKRLVACTLALVLAGPVICRAQAGPATPRAQNDDSDRQNPTEYRDLEDGQVLKLVSYILMPVGMALEWGLMRPLHHLATQTSAAPLLSGDNTPSFFNENKNANKVPPGTFGPYTINPTNNLHASNNSATLVPVPPPRTKLPPSESIPPSQPVVPESQPALH
jgi:hypothetical protein